MGQVAFRRVGGRIIPIRNQSSSSMLKKKIAGAAAVSVVGATAGVAGATRTIEKKTKGPDKNFLALGYGLQVLSGIVSGFPFKGKAGIAMNIGGSIAADLGATAAMARSTASMKGSKREKIKAFAKHQAIGTGIGYAAFGGTLLANPAVRAKLLQWGSKIVLRR